jgi:hypothetical protein
VSEFFTCFAGAGGALGPNILSQVTIPNAKANLGGTATGDVEIFNSVHRAHCDANTPANPPLQTLNINTTRIDTPPYDVDTDGDGCADGAELDKNRAIKLCGDDPWNPHDSDLAFDGPFSINVEVTEADTCFGGNPRPAVAPPFGCLGAANGTVATGSYFDCQASLDHNKANNKITGAAWCYTDNRLSTVNQQDATGGASTCPPAAATQCGDGIPGGGPPTFATGGSRAADNDGGAGTADLFAGWLDKANNVIVFDACFPSNNVGIGPFAYARVTVNAHTMFGHVDIWLAQANCNKPVGAPAPENNNRPIAIGEQESRNDASADCSPYIPISAGTRCRPYDPDQDGCSSELELSGVAAASGGQRDPFNYADHQDLNRDSAITVGGDIVPLGLKFGPVPAGTTGDVAQSMTGSASTFMRRPGDGNITVAEDIIGMGGIFGHNCPNLKD